MRPRFSLRLILIVLTIVAMAFGVWRYLAFPKKGISERQASAVKLGMTEAEVTAVVGYPLDTTSMGDSVWWNYYVAEPFSDKPGHFTVWFDREGKVVRSSRSGWPGYVPE